MVDARTFALRLPIVLWEIALASNGSTLPRTGLQLPAPFSRGTSGTMLIDEPSFGELLAGHSALKKLPWCPPPLVCGGARVLRGRIVDGPTGCASLW